MQIVTAPAALSASTPDPGSLLFIALLSLVPAVIVYIWTALALSRVFTKIGIDGWKAWVPVYNAVVFLRLGGLSGWLLLLYLIPVFGPFFVYVAVVTAAHRVGTSFGYGAGMTVLAALLFPVWASILGFGGAEPRAGRDAYAYGGDDTGEAFRALSPDFGRPGFGEQPFETRREVPAPSAWIPPAPAPYGANDAAAPTAPPFTPPAPAFDPAPVESAPGGSAWAREEPVLPPAPAPVHAPPSWDAPADQAPAEPAPVTSWWMPAPEPEVASDASRSQPASPFAAEPAPEPVLPPAAESDLPPAPVPSAPMPSAPVQSDAAPSAPVQPTPDADWQQIFEPEPEPEPAARPEPLPTPEPAPVPEPLSPRPVLRQAYVPEPDAFPEESGAVSAVVGSPTAGAPRAAASSVSAFRPGMSDFVDDTVIASRKRPAWSLQLPDGTSVELTGDTVVLGRRPVPVHSAPGAQLITVVEDTRTVSKTHALLRRQSEAWVISDLGSTNGVVVDEVEVEPGATAAVEGDFLLGDAILRLVRRER